MTQVAELIKNPLSSDAPATQAIVETQSVREAQEVQAMMVVAKRFPRNQIEATDRILAACARPSLAESALYQYNRGGTDVTGPSIRLAEAMAQAWGNVQFGIRELEQRNGESTVEAFAWDIETNTRQVKVFQVPHVRYTKKGTYRLEDPRDIYEMVANQGARRLRACILGIIPGDIIESAVDQCEATLKTKADITPERIQILLKKFADLGVTKEQLEKRIQRRIDSITPALMVNLGKIYNSIKDGMSVAGDWFEPVISPLETPHTEVKITATEKVKEALKNKKPAPINKAVGTRDFGNANEWKSRPAEIENCLDAGHARTEERSWDRVVVGCSECGYTYYVPIEAQK